MEDMISVFPGVSVVSVVLRMVLFLLQRPRRHQGGHHFCLPWCLRGFCSNEKLLFFLLRYALKVQWRSVVSEAGTDSSAVIVAGTVGLECDVVVTLTAAQIYGLLGVDWYEQEMVLNISILRHFSQLICL